MSNGPLKLLAGGGAKADPVYVDDLYSATLYTGVSQSSGYIDINTGVDCNTDGGMVWVKQRNGTGYHGIFDTERTNGYYLPTASNDNGGNIAIASNSTPFIRTTGIRYTVQGGTVNHNWFNRADYEHVVWSFKKQEKFFDIVTYTGDGTTTKTVSHNLGATPGMIIFKRTDSAGGNWIVWHRGTDNGSYTQAFLRLNGAFGINSLGEYGNDLVPTASVIKTPVHHNSGNTADSVNVSGATYIAYIFAHNDGDGEYGEDGDEDIIKCGSYTGNGSTGKFINLGFEPQFLLIKSTTSNHDWYMVDVMRGMANTAVSTAHKYIYSQSNSAEENYEARWRTEPTGFHLTTGATGINGSSNKYIYVAIRRPNKPASEFAATDLFVVDESDTTGEPKYRSTFPVDLSFDKWATQGGSDTHVSARLLQGRYVRTNSDAAAANEASYQFDYATGFYSGSSATSGAYAWLFRRAKGFMDVVTYVGDGSSYSYAHNLGATPEFKIIKIRSDSFGGIVGGSALTGGTVDYMLMLNSDAAKANTNYWSAVDSATQFSVKHSNYISNASGQTYIALLFATVAGISKVGTYTGTASDLNIDCGFSAGARLVLIKRTDSTGDWYLWDSVRGIVAGNDYYILLNTTDAQNSSYDYIDPLSSGFTVTSSANADLNASGGSYLFLAIA